MARMKEIGTAVGTLACALGIGFVMQSTETASQRYGTSETDSVQPVEAVPDRAPQAALPARFDQEQVVVMDVQEVRLTSALPKVAQVVSEAMAPEIPATPLPEAMPETTSDPVALLADDCEMSATATATRSASAALALHAPCHGDQRVTIHHNGMFFAHKTDAEGRLALTVPGLSEQAVFIFAFSDGEGAVAQTLLPDMNAFNRVVLQWTGLAGFELHAREFGAEYGSEGHVWRGSETVSLAKLTDGTGGHMISFGRADVREPHFAEVYTFPADMSGRNGQVDLSVEAEITAANCGLEIEAQTHEHVAGGPVRTRNLTLAVPGCDAIGDYLVLNNVLDDMKVAAR